MHDDIWFLFDEIVSRRVPDFTVGSAKPEHGRRERRFIRVNGSPAFPGVGQVFAVRRETCEVKSGKRRIETACGVTGLAPEAATPERLLTLNHGHRTIEANHHILDWSFDEDRIRTGHDPDSMTRLRRFAIGLIQARGLGVAETMRKLAKKPAPGTGLPEDDRKHPSAGSARLTVPPGRSHRTCRRPPTDGGGRSCPDAGIISYPTRPGGWRDRSEWQNRRRMPATP